MDPVRQIRDITQAFREGKRVGADQSGRFSIIEPGQEKPDGVDTDLRTVAMRIETFIWANKGILSQGDIIALEQAIEGRSKKLDDRFAGVLGTIRWHWISHEEQTKVIDGKAFMAGLVLNLQKQRKLRLELINKELKRTDIKATREMYIAQALEEATGFPNLQHDIPNYGLLVLTPWVQEMLAAGEIEKLPMQTTERGSRYVTFMREGGNFSLVRINHKTHLIKYNKNLDLLHQIEELEERPDHVNRLKDRLNDEVDNPQNYFVFDRVVSHEFTLAARLPDMAPWEKLRHLIEVGEAIQAMHGEGVVGATIDATHIVIEGDRAQDRAKLTGFDELSDDELVESMQADLIGFAQLMQTIAEGMPASNEKDKLTDLSKNMLAPNSRYNIEQAIDELRSI